MARSAATVLILWLCLPEVLLARVVLEAGEIDSGKVRVGVFAEVVYGKGTRDPVSGQWEKLTTASGYIKAVDAERLTIALGEGALKEQIAFARIQKLIIAEPSRVVLEAGEIDSGKVRVGAFAEVVYGKGKRDPVSGEWEKLARVSGYIKAVDAESLTLALRQGLGKKRIAFARIQKLLLAKSSRDMERLRVTTDVELPIARTDAGSWRSEGRRVRIHTRGMEERIVAWVHRATRDTLFLKRRIREKRPASIALTDISRLEVWQYREYHVKEGAIVGAAVGITTGLVALKWAQVHPIIFLGPPLVGVVGGIFGAMIGALSGHDVWQTVDHLSPSTVERRRGLSYRLSFRF